MLDFGRIRLLAPICHTQHYGSVSEMTLSVLRWKVRDVVNEHFAIIFDYVLEQMSPLEFIADD